MARTPAPQSYFPDQLVVDLQHLPVVQDMLKTLGVKGPSLGPDDIDEGLGLARLRDLTECGGAVLEVGELIALLRQRAAAERDGWQPLLGKNRPVQAVIGANPYPGADGQVDPKGHKPMEGADPVPDVDPDLARTLARAGTAGEGVRVGLVDTPWAPSSESGVVPAYRFGHATFVAGLIRRQAPQVEFELEPVLAKPGARADSWDTARAMFRLAHQKDVHILNLSLGCYTMSGGPPLVIARALERLPAEVLVIAAAGNHGALTHLAHGRTSLSGCWPAAHPRAVAIGALNADKEQPDWSAHRPWVSYLAPGVDLVSDYLKGDLQINDQSVHFDGIARWSGTSFAAATVTGLVAARTVPGSVSPEEALADVVRKQLVLPYPQRP